MLMKKNTKEIKSLKIICCLFSYLLIDYENKEFTNQLNSVVGANHA